MSIQVPGWHGNFWKGAILRFTRLRGDGESGSRRSIPERENNRPVSHSRTMEVTYHIGWLRAGDSTCVEERVF
jgi:hypothetical protein